MKLHGYCRICHKIKRVRVQTIKFGKMTIGVCDDCEEKQNAIRRGAQ